MAAKKPSSAKPKKPSTPDPTTNAALLALSPEYARAPDIPITIAQRELASLARLARSQQTRLAQIGITKAKVDDLDRFAKRLGALEKAWQKARAGVKLSAAQKKLRDEAEKLDDKLVTGGRWGCRKDEEAQAELSRIAAGSGLADTIQDLRDLVVFWGEHEDDLGKTDITKKDLDRAVELADALDEAAAHEASDVDAVQALELRNRCFWAGDELAAEIREGGRYAFQGQPKIAAKFVSRYRASAAKRARRKKAAVAKTASGKGKGNGKGKPGAGKPATPADKPATSTPNEAEKAVTDKAGSGKPATPAPNGAEKPAAP